MIKNQYLGPDPIPSQAYIDPMGRLANAVLLKAAHDVRKPNILESLDALAFWLDPWGAALWLEALGYQVTPAKALTDICGGDDVQTNRYCARSNKNDGRKGKGEIRQGTGANLTILHKSSGRKGEG